jgi:3-oxoacyl-[acyl-carrier-protein] synthase III
MRCVSAPVPIRIAQIAISLPGKAISLKSLPLDAEELARLNRLGQEMTYVSSVDSTELMIRAAQNCVAKAPLSSSVRMVISAPTLLTSYGLEIPAVAVSAALHLPDSQNLNIAQGCVGIVRGIQLAATLLRAEPDRGDIMVVTSCRASTLTRNLNHGAFFWGDAGAAVILTSRPGSGVHFVDYAERSSMLDWGAMRIPIGDRNRFDSAGEHRISVDFASPEIQSDYIRGEEARFSAVVGDLFHRNALNGSEIAAVFLPSFGRGRIPILLRKYRELADRVHTDFRYAHFGGVDLILSLDRYLEGQPKDRDWLMALTPAFTAQWAGLLMQFREAD